MLHFTSVNLHLFISRTVSAYLWYYNFWGIFSLDLGFQVLVVPGPRCWDSGLRVLDLVFWIWFLLSWSFKAC